MTMAALLIGYAVALQSSFSRLGQSQSIDREANGVKNGKSRSAGETDAFSTVGLFRA
jgi:hypothetical protein